MFSRWTSALFGLLALALLCLGLLRTVRQLEAHPALNWDMLPAMALALEWQEKDPVELHTQTYATAKLELAPETYAALTSGGVREARAADPAAFHEHLPFYRARVLYSIAVRLLHEQGVKLSDATWWIPLGCYALAAFLFLGWAAGHVSLAVAALFALGLAHTPALLNQANTSSADGMAALFVYFGAWALVERRLFFVAAGMFTLAIAARPDTLILIGFLSVALMVFTRGDERPNIAGLLVWLAASAGVYFWLSNFAGEYGWWPLLQISFVGKAVHPATLATIPDWNEYLGILTRQSEGLPGDGYLKTPTGEITGSTLVFVYAGLALLGISLAWKRAQHTAAAFLAALLATYLVRYFLFPQLWDRFYAPFYALVPLCLVSAAFGGGRPPAASTVVRRKSVTSSQKRPPSKLAPPPPPEKPDEPAAEEPSPSTP